MSAPSERVDAVVVGAGLDGPVAANLLTDAGWAPWCWRRQQPSRVVPSAPRWSAAVAAAASADR